MNQQGLQLPAGAASIEGGTSSIPIVLAKANEIYQKWMGENVDLQNHAAVDEAYKRYRTQYNEFATCYPLTFRYMIQLKAYNARAFHLYLKKVAKNPWRSRDDFLDSQAEDDALLYRILNPKCKEADVKQRRIAITKSLHDDWKAVEKAHAEVQREMEDDNKSVADKLRKALLEQAMAESTIESAIVAADREASQY